MCFQYVSTICVFLRYKASNFVKKIDVTNVKKPQNLKGLTVNPAPGLFKQCFRFQIVFCFFVGRILMDSFYILWNKFQDYQLRFIFTNHFWKQLDPPFVGKLESCLLTARQHGSYNSHINRDFQECTVIVVL